MRKSEKIFYSITENFVLIVIVFVLVQTFLEDFSVYMKWNIDLVQKIKLSALLFDLFFTFEFMVRFTDAMTKGKIRYYLFYQNGWIDFIASVPLLIFISGPYAINHLSVMGLQFAGLFQVLTASFRFLKLIKAIRVARILRIMRVLKIFGKIKNVQSVMAQRHVTKISTIVISTVILFFITMGTLQEYGYLPSQLKEIENNEKTITQLLEQLYKYYDKKEFQNIINYLLLDHEEVIKVSVDYKSRYESRSFQEKEIQYHYINHQTDDYIKQYPVETNKGFLNIYFIRYEYKKMEAFQSLMILGIIILLLFAILIIYSRHFALTVSDPIYVMRMGFEKKDYTYAVKILKNYWNDDIFRLAHDYNNRWLPAKMRKLNESIEGTTKLKFDDVFKQK